MLVKEASILGSIADALQPANLEHGRASYSSSEADLSYHFQIGFSSPARKWPMRDVRFTECDLPTAAERPQKFKLLQMGNL